MNRFNTSTVPWHTPCAVNRLRLARTAPAISAQLIAICNTRFRSAAKVAPVPRKLHRFYYGVAAIHGVSGAAVELLGLYILLVAGTKVLPARLCFRNWKPWMRAELALWMVVLLSGSATYYTWYVAPFR